ncbi:hypothetical protein DMUE_2361 [Dictyocoela muelleri]|nr:hypothetical protein DMUE_2361 [Dictyocoela muelleri]
MSLINISNNKRNLMIGIITILVLLLFLIGFIMYGSSIVSEANKKQSALIKKCSNLNGNKNKIFDNIFKKLNDAKINCFLFDDDKATIKTVSKKFENVEDLRKMKIENDIKLNDSDFKLINIETGEVKDLFIIINYIELTADELVEEKSWSGSFYKMTGGYSLPATLIEIFNHLQSLKSKLDKGKVGAAFLDDNVHIFFYNNGENKVEDIYDIRGMGDKLTALDIFKYFLFIMPKEIRKSGS